MRFHFVTDRVADETTIVHLLKIKQAPANILIKYMTTPTFEKLLGLIQHFCEKNIPRKGNS